MRQASPTGDHTGNPTLPWAARMTELDAALARMRAHPRVTHITIAVSHNTCPLGWEIQGTYEKDSTPKIPIEACSRAGGCDCGYIPVLSEIFP